MSMWFSVYAQSCNPLNTYSIAEQPDPRERMVQVVKWYLSAFHAGRKGSVAKKPYNPILGEVFFCHWDLPCKTEEPSTNVVSEALSLSLCLIVPFFQAPIQSISCAVFCFQSSSPAPVQDTLSDGPVPWSSPNNVSFVAEQVSHHPPSE